MNILCVIHADFETPGVIETWAYDKGYTFQISKPYKGDKLPNASNFDFLIVMGGPQSPLNLDESPYLIDEINLIKESIQQNKRILGFCLGAQLIGESLGAKTERSPEKEVGVYPVTLTEKGLQDPLLQEFSQSFPVIHWHNDMPGLLDHSTLLGYSEGCPRQIIRYKPLAYGFQCHLEITLDGIKTMIDAVPEDLKPSMFTQTKEELITQNYTSINNMMRKILDKFVELKG